MTHEEAFLADILEHPEDDTPRRVYADWLMDQSDPLDRTARNARGELIHLQCDLAHAEEGPRRAELDARQRQLLAEYQREWDTPLLRLGCRSLEYRRGFVEGVGLPAS